MFDIDYFKKINDTYGHKAGDTVLISLSKLIKNNIRKVDVFSRIGGEEFAIILPNTDLQKAKELANKLKNLVEEYILVIDNQEIRITISIGLSTLDEKNQTYNQLLKIADTNLYEAKSKGRNTIVG